MPFPHQTIYFGEDKDGGAPPVHVALGASGATLGATAVAALGADGQTAPTEAAPTSQTHADADADGDGDGH